MITNNSIDKENAYITVSEAAKWASRYVKKNVTNSNIAYLVNYGKIANCSLDKSKILININELKLYYDNINQQYIELSSPLSFAQYKEAETTKHIHRLHPYKGKFIPQLVEYFLDNHIDHLKKTTFFKQGDIILDPFCGSGTTLSVANELNMHGVGIDISKFNSILSNVKLKKYDIDLLAQELKRLINKLDIYNAKRNIVEFENKLNILLSDFNNTYFSPKTYKRAVFLKEIDELKYADDMIKTIYPLYENLVQRYNIDLSFETEGRFFDKWYMKSIREEIIFLKNEIAQAPTDVQDILYIILSRTARSCRATTHSDLATLISPINSIYYCKKHGRICRPLFSITKWFKSYVKDTVNRLKEFSDIRTNTEQICINADSITVDLIQKVGEYNNHLANLVLNNKIDGIFSSPPYVGMIDYHEQHAYAYDILGIERYDDLEIGKLKNGQGKIAQQNYIQGISNVLINMKTYMKENYHVFLVANDKFNLYPAIADLSGMYIENRFERPVINRTEKDKGRYSESIFHLRDK